MLTHWTPAVTRALALARLWAKRLGAADPELRHLLLGFLQEDEGRVALLLDQQGVSLTAARTQLGALEPLAFDPNRISEDHARLSLGFEGVLHQARAMALDLTGEPTVASEHVFLAILQHDADLAASLQPLGLSVTCLEKQLTARQAPPLALDEPLNLVEPTEQIDLARILDANADRAREAIRVIEDFCRFVLDDGFLSGEWKRMRHDLTAACAEMQPGLFLVARETQADVGTSHRTPSEELRVSLAAVLGANTKRLQEALRSLEEYGKVHNPKLGQTFESLRYRAYTLEKATRSSHISRQRLDNVRLYLLATGSLCAAALEWTIKEAVAGGVQVVQLREKRLADRELLQRAREVRRWTKQCGALFVMNDRPDIARLAEADGVHVGQEELTVKDARRILGPDALIGVSTHTLAQARQAVLDGATYIGVGPTFPSATKTFAAHAGLEFVRQVAAEITLPAFAIGGINANNIDQVIQAGFRRVAVSNAICQAEDPRGAATLLRHALDEVRVAEPGALATGGFPRSESRPQPPSRQQTD